jgi:copper chaperone
MGSNIFMNMKTETLKVEGMSCGHCVKALEKSLAKVKGLTKATVTVGSAEVSYDPALASRADFGKAVSEAGFVLR